MSFYTVQVSNIYFGLSKSKGAKKLDFEAGEANKLNMF